LVGPSGKIVAVDSQPKMISGLKRRARVAPTNSMAVPDYDRQIDLVFAFAVVHEMPSADLFLPRPLKP